MRDLYSLNNYRCTDHWVKVMFGSTGDSQNGVFEVPYTNQSFYAPDGARHYLRVIASISDNWEQVSVSLEHRTPTWEEMDFIKRTFFKEDETVMQLHVPPSEHINVHPHCLHLWRPRDGGIPRPPSNMVA
jgi:hypothetical protein